MARTEALHGFADGGGIGRVVLASLAAHAVGGNELGGQAKRRAQWWAPEQASMPMVHDGNAATTPLSLARATLGWRITTAPPALTPCRANTFLARSIPAYRMLMDFPFRAS